MKINCRDNFRMAFILWICVFLILVKGQEKGPPPQRPPEAILDELTQQNRIPVEYYYVDDSNKGRGTHYKYSNEDIQGMVKDAKAFIKRSLQVAPPMPPSPASSSQRPPSQLWSSQITDLWLVHALQHFPVDGHDVVLFGSTSPWYESLLLASGARHVTVMEYNKLTYEHPSITTATISDYFQGENAMKKYDSALSLSSFDHDGLGRYGDPIHPNADLHAMQTARDMLKENGTLFLTVPIGPDVIVWNLHRRYGRLRLPLLLNGWRELRRLGWNEEYLDADLPYVRAYEPIFILQPA